MATNFYLLTIFVWLFNFFYFREMDSDYSQKLSEIFSTDPMQWSNIFKDWKHMNLRDNLVN